MSDLRVADLVARTLKAAGVTHAFGMPGGEVITLLDALERADIRFVLARNETSAAMMAAGCCAGTGAPGLLVTTLGPGLANAVNGIADAWQERTPLIVITGVVERGLRGRYTHQVVDHSALLAPLVKASFEIEAQAPEAVVARAIRLATTAPCGPVHLDLSPAVAAERVADAHASPVRVAQLTANAQDPAIVDLRQRLAKAERPLIIAGYEAARGGASTILGAIAQQHGVPIVTTYKAKGVVDENHPASLGAAGLSPLADEILLPLVRRADLVLLAGYDPIEMRPGWLQPVQDSARLVEIGGPADHGMHESSLRIDGPVAACLEALFTTHAPRRIWRDGEVAAARAALQRAFAAPAAWGPHAVFKALQEFAATDSLVTVDSGAHRILLSQQWRARRPLEMLQSAGWCTMGSALPLAIGAKLARPEREVIAVVGDGGFEMTMGECGTLRDQALPVIVVVLQDEGLELIALKQDQSQLERRGVAMGPTRYAQIAEAFGGAGAEVSNVAELRAALAQARERSCFSVIACRIEPRAYVGRI